MSDYITVITASSPINKRFVEHPDGSVEKIVRATLASGVAQSVHVPDADSLATVLGVVAESENKVIVPGRWRGDDGKPFNIVTKRELAERLGVVEENLPREIVEVSGQRCAARLSRCIEPSSWLLLDADSPEGIRPEWAEMDAAQRLALWEPLLPGIGEVACVEMRSSSARVRCPSALARGPSHIWLKISDPSRLDILRAHVEVAQVNAGLSFECPHRSRADRTKIIGRSRRGLFDLSVWTPGRIVFVARPDIGAAPSYVLDNADVGIVDGKASLDISRIREPDGEAMQHYKAKTDISHALRRSRSGGLTIQCRGVLSWETEIESRGVLKTLREWIDGMKPGEKLRCEAPFRGSSSEAAFIAFDKSGEPFVHDSGTATTYRLASAAGEVIDELNARYALVSEGGKARVYERKRTAVFGEYYESIVAADFKVMHDNRRIETGKMADGRPRYIGVGTYWLRCPDRRQYLGGVVFDPTGNRTAPDQLNIWMGFGVEPRPGGSWKRLRQHILEVICDGNEVHFGYLLSWMARVVQFPAQPGEVAIVMQGGEGTGKGTLAKAMAHILGPSAFATSRSNDVVGQFNAHLRHRVFLFCDEAFFAGKRQDADALKALITEPTFSTEGKGGAILPWPNYLHMMLASNAEWVINAATDSRRYFVLKVRPLTPDRDEAYFAAIRAELADGGYEAMLHDLLQHDLTGFSVRKFPETPALIEQRERSLTGPTAWWRDALARGHVAADLHTGWQEWLPTQTLYDNYLIHTRARRHGPEVVGDAELGRWLRKWGAVPKRPHGHQRGYTLGTLAQARAAFCRATGLPDEWEFD